MPFAGRIPYHLTSLRLALRMALAAGWLSLLPQATAEINGSDNFAAASKDTQKWGPDIQTGTATLTQSGGVVRLSSTSASATNGIDWSWVPALMPMAQSWSVQLDVIVPATGETQQVPLVGLGLKVCNSENPDEWFGMGAEASWSGGQGSVKKFTSQYRVDGGSGYSSTSITTTNASVRVAWDAGTQMFTAFYDRDGSSNGYAWKAINSFSPLLDGWNLSATTGFEVRLSGDCSNTLLPASFNFHADNFAIEQRDAVDLYGGDTFFSLPSRSSWRFTRAEGGAHLATSFDRLEYWTSDNGPAAIQTVWVPGSGAGDKNWEVSVDFHLADVPLPNNGDFVRLGFAVEAGSPLASLHIEHANEGGVAAKRFRWSGEQSGGGEGSVLATSADGSIRVAFDAASQTLSFFYDDTGSADGYVWKLLGSLDLNTVAGGSGFDADSRFAISLMAENTGSIVDDDDAYFDNFEAYTELAAPVGNGFSGFDGFSAPTKDPANWTSDISWGNAALSQNGDGVLRYFSSDENALVGWPWSVGAPVASDWAVQLDVHVPNLGTAFADMGLVARNSADARDQFKARMETGAWLLNFVGSASLDGQGNGTGATATGAFGAVRIAWDASDQMLSASYDPNGPADGYQWTVIKTFNPVSGGWNMKSGDEFLILIEASSYSKPVSLDHHFFADNFYAYGLTGTPNQAVLPQVQTLAATSVGADSATLRGTANAKGSSHEVAFQYGTTSSYGQTIHAAPSAVIGTDDTAVLANLTGLLPHTTYHYRIHAAGAAGARNGAGMTFKTANRSPIAAADNRVVVPGAVVVIPVLGNDSDPDGDPLTLASVTQPGASVGKVSKGSNHLIFSASASFIGDAQFTYVVKDGFGGSAMATVTVTAGDASIAPTTQDIGAEATTYEVEVNGNGAWSATESLPWVSVGAPGGVGDGSVAIQVQANTGKNERSGTVTIGGQTHTITQAAALQLPVLTAPAVVPDGIVSGDYELLIETTGLPVKYTVTGAPPGLTLNPITSILGGKPTKAGAYNVSIKAANAAGAAAVSLNFTLIVHPLPDGAIGNFVGYIEPNQRLNDGLGSRVELTTTLTGVVSGKLISGTASLPFKGQLDAVLGDGSVNILVPVARKSGAFLALDLTIDGTTRAVTGELLEKGAPGTAVSSWDNIWNRAMAR